MKLQYDEYGCGDPNRLHSHLFVLGLEACGLRSDYGAAAAPLLLRGEHLIEDADGNVHRTSRPVSAVCRCGKSASQPWCDGTHKFIPDRQKP